MPQLRPAPPTMLPNGHIADTTTLYLLPSPKVSPIRGIAPLCWVFGLEPSRSSNRGGVLPDFSPTAGMSRSIAPSTWGAMGRGGCAKRRHQSFPFDSHALPRIRGQEGQQALAVPGDVPGAVLGLEGRGPTRPQCFR